MESKAEAKTDSKMDMKLESTRAEKSKDKQLCPKCNKQMSCNC